MRYVAVSRAVHVARGAALQAAADAAGDGSLRLWPVDADTDLGGLPLEQFVAGFVSADVLGASSKTRLEATMQKFCDLLSAVPRLRWVQVSTIGVDRPQYHDWMRRGARLTNCAGIASETVALTALAGLLHLGRDLPRWLRQQAERRWQPERGEHAPRELAGQRAVVVGLGDIGRRVAELCTVIGLQVVGFNRSGRAPAGFGAPVCPIGALDEHLAAADWLVLCCPLTPQTRHLIDRARLSRLREGACLVDVSRGGVVALDALRDALAVGRLGGAFLDVMETEPLPADDPLWSMPNVVVTPHIAGDYRERGERIIDLFQRNLIRFVRGEVLINDVVPEGL